MIDFIMQPWPWYLAGPLIGLMVPLLLYIGNKSFGVSSSLRHACAACVPGNISFLKYDWRKEQWNLLFVLGILIGGAIAGILLVIPNSMIVDPALHQELAGYGVAVDNNMVPAGVFSFERLFSLSGLAMMVGGGFLIGFGARYAGGCTSGHAIMGISNLQWPSVIATACFMAGGFLTANVILPILLAL